MIACVPGRRKLTTYEIPRLCIAVSSVIAGCQHILLNTFKILDLRIRSPMDAESATAAVADLPEVPDETCFELVYMMLLENMTSISLATTPS